MSGSEDGLNEEESGMRKGGIRGVDGEEGGLLSNGVVSSAGEGDGGGPTSFVPSLLRRGRFALLEFGVELEDKFSDSLMFFRYTGLFDFEKKRMNFFKKKNGKPLLRVETGEGDGLGRKTPEFWRFAINLRLL